MTSALGLSPWWLRPRKESTRPPGTTWTPRACCCPPLAARPRKKSVAIGWRFVGRKEGGVAGFHRNPASLLTLWSAPRRTRTYNPLIKSQTLRGLTHVAKHYTT